MAQSVTIASAPGNLLLLGTCHEISPVLNVLALSTPARVRCFVSSSNATSAIIRVRSCGFSDAPYLYNVVIRPNDVCAVTERSDSSSTNALIQSTLTHALVFASTVKGLHNISPKLENGLEISITSDKLFYIFPPSVFTSLPSLEETLPSGIGASAAIVSSLLAALLVHFGVFGNPLAPQNHLTLFNLGQLILNNCGYLGIRSGVDIAVATHGSQVYHRTIVSGPISEPGPGKEFENISSSITTFHLPPFFRVIVAIVDANPTDNDNYARMLDPATGIFKYNTRWTDLQQHQEHFISLLNRLTRLHNEKAFLYKRAIEDISTAYPSHWLIEPPVPEADIIAIFSEIRELSISMRDIIKSMGTEIAVTLEQDRQSLLLNACLSLRGVIAGGIPRVHGPRAIWLIIPDPVSLPTNHALSVTRSVDEVLRQSQATPHFVTSGHHDGVQIESLDNFLHQIIP